MKLKNKLTGEIVETVIVDHGAEWEMHNAYANEAITKYSSLAELNAEWEDAPEEPKNFWYIKPNGCIEQDNIEAIKCDIPKEYYDKMVEIGNYFETREEAENAVEKLKAWKRLKDKGSKIIDYEYYGGTNTKGEFSGEVKVTIGVSEVDKYLFNLLFGGEE